MKIIAFILAFLVLALSVIPCADNGIAANDGKTKTEIAKTTPQKSGTHQDDCSPFCTCNCCAGFSINHFIASINILPQFSINPSDSFLPSATIEVALPIWQPPQLV